MYCLYKTLEWFKNLRQQGIGIPLITQRGTLGLDTSQVYSDLWEFELLYHKRSEIENCQRAADLYVGPLLAGAPYDWISPLKRIMSWPALSCLRPWFSSVKKPAS